MRSAVFGFVTVVLAACLVAACPAQALATIELGFFGVSNNDVGDTAIGEAQMRVVISALDTGQVLFEFFNDGPEDSAITDIYFDDGSLLGIAYVDNSSIGVSFTQDEIDPVSPKDLPGGNAIGFETTASFAADSDNPVAPNGIDPGESVGIVFNLLDGRVYDDVLADLATRELMIGIKVQGFASEGSESFANVPEPATIVIWSMLAGLGLAFGRWRRKKAA